MPILIKLYGKLRENVKDVDLEKGLPVTCNIEENNVHFVYDIVEKFAISEDELSHIFVNGKYCGIGKEIRDGDRVGLFPKNMALMFAEIPDLNSVYVTVKLFESLRKYGRPKFGLEVPEGSTIKTVINKIKFPKKEKNFNLFLNGSPKFDENLVIKGGDVLAIFPLGSGYKN